MAEAAPRIIFCGSTTLDTIYRVPMLPSGAGKILPTEMAVVAHGMAASAATAAARMGAEAHLFSRLGEDETGRRIVAELEGEGVRCAAVRRFQGLRSPLCTVLVDAGGERLVVPYYDSAMPTDPGWLPLDLVATADAVQTDVRWPAGAGLVLDRAKAAGIPAVLDADVGPVDVIADLARRSSHAVFSEPAALAVSGAAEAGQAVARLAVMFPAFVAVTVGPGGCLWQEHGTLRQAWPPEVRAVDTLAAGDVFHGVFTWALARGEAVEWAIRLANAAAARKCTSFGGRLGAPRRAELEAMMQDGTQGVVGDEGRL